jgi:hypothetical protein
MKMRALTLAAPLLLSFAARAGDGPVVTPKGEEEAPRAEESVDDSQPPAAQKEQLKLFNGTWRCDGKANTDLAEEVPTKITLAFKSDLGGRWITLKLDEQKSAKNPKAITSTEIWGHSDALGGFVMNGADSQGGFYAGSSTGWVGDRLWWTVDTVKNGKHVKVKNTYTRKSDKELVFERALDVTGSGDAYRVFYEGTCKK